MPSTEELQATIEARLTEAGYVASTLEASPGSTLVPRARRADSAGGRAVEALGALDEKARLADRLELHETLGEGGMGLVRLGTQRALGRPVAVKTLRSERRHDADAALKLLREAWVTGRLEHPNVVPVYDVAIEPDGSPLIVLKKIEGTGWDQLMHDADALRARFGVEDPLEWNLRVLMQLCNAVSFAHERGIVHRDLKPENVMIGSFGEVYLVDWGIAVSLRDDGSGRLPLAKDASQMAGTLLYMAPEMLGGAAARLSERTDVYLLGAILFEIVAGHPPHRGAQLMELVAQIIESSPELPADIPAGLKRLVRAAMAPRAEKRPSSAEEVRLEIQSFLVRRDALLLSERADTQLEALRETIRALPDLETARETVYARFHECRFGYRHALQISPQSDEARDGLQHAIEAMVRFELDHGEPDTARALLTEAPEEVPALAEEVEAARAARQQEADALRRVREAHDPEVGRRTRVVVLAAVGTTWCIAPLFWELLLFLEVVEELTHPMVIGHGLVSLGIFAGFAYWARHSLGKTHLNRLVAACGALAMSGTILIHAADWWNGYGDVWHAIRYSFVAWSALTVLVAMAVDPRVLVPAGLFALSFVVTGLRPRWSLWAMSCSVEVLFWVLLWVWLRRGDLGYFRDRIGAAADWSQPAPDGRARSVAADR